MVNGLCTIWPLMRNICGDYAVCIRDYARTVSVPDSRSGALEVVRLVGDGRSNAEIGAELGITTKTVEGHLRRSSNAWAAVDGAPAPGAYLRASVRIVSSWSHSTRNASWPFVEWISR